MQNICVWPSYKQLLKVTKESCWRRKKTTIMHKSISTSREERDRQIPLQWTIKFLLETLYKFGNTYSQKSVWGSTTKYLTKTKSQHVLIIKPRTMTTYVSKDDVTSGSTQGHSQPAMTRRTVSLELSAQHNRGPSIQTQSPPSISQQQPIRKGKCRVSGESITVWDLGISWFGRT